MVVPVAGLTAAVSVIVVPWLACVGEAVRVVVVPTGTSWEMVTLTGAEVEAAKVELPEYAAESEAMPTGSVDVLKDAEPPDTAAVPICVVPL